MSGISYHTHLSGPNDLITTYQEVRSGFVQMALEKNRRAIPYIEEARALKLAATVAKKPSELLDINEIRPALLTAAGLSDKALNHLADDDKTNAIKGLIDEFLEPAGKDFIDELVYRFLLIRGDSLGGTMRNLAGFLAESKLKRAIIASLNLYRIPFYWLHSPTKKWVKDGEVSHDVDNTNGFYWNHGQDKILVFNRNVPIVRNNIDVCVIESDLRSLEQNIKNAEKYLILGELKGGIDPAGADEHWKTARTALNRISESFTNHSLNPKTFFVGAAIETKMASEIWAMLESETLSNAANLTNPDQVASVCNWLVIE